MVRIILSIGAIQVLIMVAGLLRAKALAVLVGPTGFGVIGTIDQIILTVVNLSALSLPFTAMKFMARSHGNREEFQRTFGRFSRALIVLSGAAVVVSITLLIVYPSIFGEELAAHRVHLAIGLLMVPALMLNILFANTLAAAEAAGASAGMTFAFNASVAAAAVTGAILAGIGGLYVASVVVAFSTTFVAALFLKRRLGVCLAQRTGSLIYELRTNSEVVSYSALLYAALSAYTVTLLASRYVVFSALGAAEAGLLQAQIALATSIGAVIAPMNNLYLTPLVNRQAPVGARAAAAHEFASKAAILILLGALPFVLFPRLALSVLFSGQFAAAGQLLFVFVLWQCFYQVANVYLQLLIGLDDIVFFTVTTCVSYLGAALFFPTLVAHVGGAGTGVALVAAMIVAGAAAVTRLSMKFKVAVPPRVWWRLAILLTAITGAGLLFAGGHELTAGGLVVRAIYALIVSAFVFSGLTSDERRMIMMPARLLARP